ncbi:hypothetical protein [Mycobacterium sp. SMC-4]|uniref:hypothetical protein n=1 Tax=Mycobacterium sp. SMC-4 TaxID=2857059 RepID=UPI0021B1D3EF|nr:hypothetical protein [Mycobacterium sp. SMC-4]UXA19501.1 hypothetical protein KXD98_07845 [Mycobacterium sp. SMC-4]
MRPKTPPRIWTDDDGREHRTMTVQRCCNGCRREIGDVTAEEIERAVAGLPLLDVRDECPWCATFLAEAAS